MKSEKFDEAIKQRFEDMESSIPVSDAELDALQHYVNARTNVSFYGNYRNSIVLISLISTLIAGFISWNFLLQIRHAEMVAKLENLQYKLRLANAKKIIFKTDTVYIAGLAKKYIEKNSIPNSTPAEAMERYAAVTTVTAKSESSTKVRTKKLHVSLEENLRNQNITYNGLSKVRTLEVPLRTDSTLVQKIADAGIAPVLPADTNRSLAIASIASTSLSNTIKNFVRSLKNIKIQAGVGTQKGNRQSGNELVVAFLFTQRWSLSTGMRLLNINHERYENKEGFQQLKGDHFQLNDPTEKMDTAAIRNVGTQSTLVQLPVTLSYALPVKKEYSLILGLGTDIDVASRQHIGYDRINNSTSIERKNFETKNTVVKLNNIVLSAGIQKQWHKLSLQLSTFVSPQITHVIYKKDKLYAGLRFRLLYNFGK